ncbi:hypothetical protein ILYODFUR_032259 [Ilyodon furcidens]|uniref:Uncharacterized protein n=1 Tax=Ilyodon furcidens TaxID=33524 RepID=A0ABV0SQY6_9TELE
MMELLFRQSPGNLQKKLIPAAWVQLIKRSVHASHTKQSHHETTCLVLTFIGGPTENQRLKEEGAGREQLPVIRLPSSGQTVETTSVCIRMMALNQVAISTVCVLAAKRLEFQGQVHFALAVIYINT